MRLSAHCAPGGGEFFQKKKSWGRFSKPMSANFKKKEIRKEKKGKEKEGKGKGEEKGREVREEKKS